MTDKQLTGKKISGAILLTLLVLSAINLAKVQSAKARAAWQQKVDPGVLEEASRESEAEFLVFLDQQADLSAAANMVNKIQKGTYVYEQLTAVARRSQPAVIQSLKSSGVEFRPYWVSNMIWVKGSAATVEALAKRSDVARIFANPKVKLDIIDPYFQPEERDSAEGVEWNIALVKAPEVWGAGFTGQGVVIGGQDTGYDWTHPALINQYRGWDGQDADHNFNWHDAIHEDNPNTIPGNTCGYDLLEPCDDHGHGTHTMGILVGDDGGNNQIGMAPGAKWIGCRNMEQGWGTPATYAECYEWFIAPYPMGGDPMQDGDPAKAPDVINNSWSCPTAEGCTDPEILLQVVDNVRAAGILTAHSAGNSGSSCSTVNQPPAMYDSSFSVGATDNQDIIAGFSSRGPSIYGENKLLKPDISAPGVQINSSFPGGSYGTLSGTSMSSPHVAGLAALLISADPSLAGDVDGLEQVIEQTAVPLTSSEGCGGDTEDAVPNHVYGWGRIDAWAAFEALDREVPYLFYSPVLVKP